MEIIPTLFTTDRQRAEEKLKKYQGIFDWVQLDIIDGIFAVNRTLTPADFSQISQLNKFKIDVHLMVDEPVTYLSACQNLKAQRLTGQIEMMNDQEQFVEKCRQVDCQSGLALDLPTPLEKLDRSLLPHLNLVLLMSIKAGFSGQKFSPQVLEKVRKLAKIKKERRLKFKIALDGGINLETIKKPYCAGAEIFYIGNYLFSDPKGALEKLKNAVLKGQTLLRRKV